MIIPNYHITNAGNIRFEMTHLSESKKEAKEFWFDRLKYVNWIDVNPIDNKIIKIECECPAFRIINKYISPCKHLKKSISLLEEFGITYGGNLPEIIRRNNG